MLKTVIIAVAALSSVAHAGEDIEVSQEFHQLESERPNSEKRPVALSLEVAGRAGLYSLNLDRSINTWLGMGAGLSYLTLSTYSYRVDAFVIPVYANFYANPHRHRLFGTLGLDIVAGSYKEDTHRYSYSNGTFSSNRDSGHDRFRTGVGATTGIGYEFRGTSGFLFRAAPYLLITQNGMLLTGGISLGGTF